MALLMVLGSPLDAQTVRGQVIDSVSQTGVPAATLTLIDALGTTRATAEADESGTFVITAPVAADYRLRVEGVGYSVYMLGPMRIAEDVTHITVRLVPLAVPLDTLTAQAEGRVPALDRVGFYDRKALGHGRFIDRDAIDRRQPRRIEDLLRGIPGIRLVTDPNGFFADVRMRAAGLTSFNARPNTQCLPPVYLDGLLVSHGNQGAGDRYNLNSVLPQDVEAVEIYAGPAQVPPQYGGASSACGVLLIWTRK
jgi:hypothetical protein